MARPKLDVEELLYYEISASLWASLVSNDVVQGFLGWYYARKLRRKLRRYDAACARRERIDHLVQE